MTRRDQDDRLEPLERRPALDSPAQPERTPSETDGEPTEQEVRAQKDGFFDGIFGPFKWIWRHRWAIAGVVGAGFVLWYFRYWLRGKAHTALAKVPQAEVERGMVKAAVINRPDVPSSGGGDVRNTSPRHQPVPNN